MSDRTLIACDKNGSEFMVFNYNSLDEEKAKYIKDHYNCILPISFMFQGKDGSRLNDWTFGNQAMKYYMKKDYGLDLPMYFMPEESEKMLNEFYDMMDKSTEEVPEGLDPELEESIFAEIAGKDDERKLFESIRLDEAKSIPNPEVKGPYELGVCCKTVYGCGPSEIEKMILKKAKKDPKFGIHVFNDRAYIYGEESDLKDLVNNSCDELGKPDDAKEMYINHIDKSGWIDTDYGEGSLSYGNVIKAGQKINPEYVNWINRLEKPGRRGGWDDLAPRARKLDIEPRSYNYGRQAFRPRHKWLEELAAAGDEEAKRYLEKDPIPSVTAEETPEDLEPKVLYGLFSDGGNCYSSRDDDNWYWASTEDDPTETRAEFSKRLHRACDRKASYNYREYCPGSGKVRIFSSKEEFIKAANKVGINPKFD